MWCCAVWRCGSKAQFSSANVQCSKGEVLCCAVVVVELGIAV